MVAERFGLNLKRSRRHAELTQGELAERSSLTRQAISLIEVGERRPHPESFVSLLAALDIEPPLLLDAIRWLPAQKRLPGSYLVEPAARPVRQADQVTVLAGGIDGWVRPIGLALGSR